MSAPVLSIAGVEKRYHGLRPLRLHALSIAAAERVAIMGLDQGASEVLVNLVTGASLPDRGTVEVLGHDTAAIQDGDAWLASLDRFGIVSERAVLLDGATLLQNLALPFTLQVDPVPPEIAARVAQLADECGIGGDPASLARVTGEVGPEVRARLHLARAVALNPALLVIEHPTALVPPASHAMVARDLGVVTAARGLATLLITQDAAFARAAADRVLTLHPGTGQLSPVRRGWFR